MNDKRIKNKSLKRLKGRIHDKDPISEALQFRRCHVCEGITINENDPVLQCRQCHKHLAPFFYFDDRFSPVHSDVTIRPKYADGEIIPIYGLTVYWGQFGPE